jgi:hypothetical protein
MSVLPTPSISKMSLRDQGVLCRHLLAVGAMVRSKLHCTVMLHEKHSSRSPQQHLQSKGSDIKAGRSLLRAGFASTLAEDDCRWHV